MSIFTIYDCPPREEKHQKVAESANVAVAVQQFLATDYESKSMLLREKGHRCADEDAFYVIIRDANCRLTMEQKIEVFGLFALYRNGAIFGRGRAMMEVLWRLTSYAGAFVPLVCASLQPKAWQEIANILISGDSVPSGHYNVLILMCHMFGSWALLESQQSAIKQLFQTRNVDVFQFSCFSSNQIKVVDVGDIEQMEIHARVLVECYATISANYFKRAILDSLAQKPQLSNEEIAALVLEQETEQECYGFFNYSNASIPEFDQLVASIDDARHLLARKEEIILSAFLSN